MYTLKIIKILITGAVIFLCITCKKEPSENFPNVSVSLSVNLISNPIPVGTPVICPNSTNQGAAGKGIILYTADGTNYLAFSALCTYYPKDTSAITINGFEGQCPKCKSIFNLIDGSVLHGPAQYPLKQYSVLLDGNTLLIQN